MKVKIKKIFYLIILSFICGIILSHYLESFETNFLFKIRNMYYFSSSSSKSISKGGVYSKYKGIDGAYFNPVHHVQSVGDGVTYLLSKYIDEKYYMSTSVDEIDTALILKRADDMMNFVDTIFIQDKECYRLSYDFPEKIYNLNAGWYSGMAQGLASELMIASFVLSNDTSYLNKAKGFINLLDVSIQDGGVKIDVPEGVWFEEYAQINIEHIHPLVLNGHIFAIDGLYALVKITGSSYYEQLLANSIHAVEGNITKYLVGNTWSRYDLHGNIANMSYHKIHISQLRRLIFLSEQMGLTCDHMNKMLKKLRFGLIIPEGIWVRLFITHNNMLLFMILVNSIFSLLFFLLVCKFKSIILK